jgi:hypothetical protein
MWVLLAASRTLSGWVSIRVALHEFINVPSFRY